MGAQDQRKPIGSLGRNKGDHRALGDGDELFSLSAHCSSHCCLARLVSSPVLVDPAVPLQPSLSIDLHFCISTVDDSKHNNVKKALYARFDLANRTGT
jgi:hypothetical protein